MTDVTFRNCQLAAKEFGRIEAVTGWSLITSPSP